MIKTEITIERVLELIEAYGADAGAWPDDERDLASSLVQQHPERFDEALSLARLLDEALAAEKCEEPTPALVGRILATAPSARSQGWTSWLKSGGLRMPSGIRWPAGAAFASMAMGIVGGYAYAASGTLTYDEASEIYYSAFGYDAESVWLEEEIEE